MNRYAILELMARLVLSHSN